MAVKMSLRETIKISLQSIGSNRLRTFLTALIIAIGITALVGILTSIDAIEKSMTESFSAMGSSAFNIQNRGLNIRIGGQGTRPKNYPNITYEDAIDFRDQFDFPAVVSVKVFVTGGATVKYKSEKTNPNISVQGGDSGFLETGGYKLDLGRNFTPRELELGTNVVIIGPKIRSALFEENEDPLNKVITIGNLRCTVIGVLEDKGSSAGMGGSNTTIIPLARARAIMPATRPSYTITVMMNRPEMMEAGIGEATALFRNVRGLEVKQENNFEITKSDAIVQALMSNLAYVTAGAIVIGLITLVGASIGLMNIMLVSVTERTREIGLRKAVGATPRLIRQQFLTEAIVICIMGGIGGILLGLIIGNMVALALGASFLIPWIWLVLGIAVCVIVGVISGYYPASKASQLDPVEALRYE